MRLGWFRRRPQYGWAQFGGDLSGGVVAALIALPYGLAMASLMGLPAVMGILTSILTAPVTVLLGRNPVLIGGTGSVTVPFIAAAVEKQGIGGAAKVSIAAAVIMMAFCVLRLGRHIARVPPTVVSGFSCGIGIMMFVSQLDTILGIGPAPGSTISQLMSTLGHLNQFQAAPLIIGVTVIVAAMVTARWIPVTPAPLMGIGMAVLVARLLGLHSQAIGEFSAETPDFAGFVWGPKDVVTVLPSAIGLAFVVSVNILITSKVVEHFRGRHQRTKAADADAELGAYGIANICSGVFGAPMSVGIPARSLAVVRCGGTTRLANLIHAVILILVLQFGTGVIAQIPVSALAGVTAWMGLCLLDWGAWRRLPLMNRMDAAGFLATAISVVLVNAVLAIIIGCAFHLIRTWYKENLAAIAETRFSAASSREAA